MEIEIVETVTVSKKITISPEKLKTILCEHFDLGADPVTLDFDTSDGYTSVYGVILVQESVSEITK